MIVLIPAYEPDRKLISLLQELAGHQIVIVDDGSGPSYSPLFTEARILGADVVTHRFNRGKGSALKTGFAHIRANYPGHAVVCADSDGQHRSHDIVAVADRLASSEAAMVLGTRLFSGDVPARSKLGNAATRLAFRLATGVDLRDTQTGLRGYPAHMLPWLDEVGGDRFEYELRLLLRATRERLAIEEVEIATIYLEHNASSHFRPIRDSARIYRPLLTFTASSLLGFAVDAICLFLLTALTGNVALSAVGARVISATVNYGVNASVVFGMQHESPPRRVSGIRYALLAAAILGANIVVLQWLTAAIGSLVIAKGATELLLFSASYVIQKHVVFARQPHRSEKPCQQLDTAPAAPPA